LEADYFRTLLQSNCGVSVLDFTPRPDGGSPHICLNRLNQVYRVPLLGGVRENAAAIAIVMLLSRPLKSLCFGHNCDCRP